MSSTTPSHSQPVIVLLRGLARESAHWGDLPAQLREKTGLAVVVADLPGMGDASGESAPWVMADLASTVLMRLEKNDAGPWHLVGLSLGGMVALEMQRQRPTQIGSVLLINSSVAGLQPFYRRLQWRCYPLIACALFSPVAQRERLILKLTSNHLRRRLQQFSANVLIAKQKPTSWLTVFKQLWAASRYSLPAKPSCKMLILQSNNDRLVHPMCSASLAKHWQLPLVSHPTAGHDLSIDDPTWLVQQIKDFIQSVLEESSADTTSVRCGFPAR